MKALPKLLETEFMRATGRQIWVHTREVKEGFTTELLQICEGRAATDPRFTPPIGKNPKREMQWAESRRALLAVLEKGAKATSLSHSKERVIAVGTADLNTCIGVDIEKVERSVSERAAQRITDSDESKLALEPLDLWVIKEAVFKTALSEDQRGQVSWSTQVRSLKPEPWGGIGTAWFQEKEYFYLLYRRANWVTALGWLPT